MKRLKNGQEVPQGEACEICFTGHKQYFNHLSWEEFCVGMLAEDSEIASALQDAKEVESGVKSKEWSAECVLQTEALILNCSKEFIGLTGNEVRKALGLQKITKAILDKIPSIKVLSEEGLELDLYLFLSPAKPFRTITISSQAACDRQKHLMAIDAQKWAGQGEHVWLHSSQSCKEKQGVQALLQSMSVQPLDDFVSKEQQAQQQLAHKTHDADGGADESRVAGLDDSDSECELVGAAADEAKKRNIGLLAAGVAQTSSSKKQKTSTGAGAGAKSSAGSELGVAGDEDDIDRMTSLTCGKALTTRHEQDTGDKPVSHLTPIPMTIACLKWTTETLACIETLALTATCDNIKAWRQALPLATCLEKHVDGRTITGLRSKSKKLEQSGSPQAGVLRNYIKLIEYCQVLFENNLKTYEDTLLATMVEKVEAEVELPLAIKAKLVERVALDVADKHDMARLVNILNPFIDQAWSSSEPTLAGLRSDEATKIATYEDMVSTILGPMLVQGASGAKDVVCFCKHAVEVIPADQVEMNLVSAACAKTASAVYNALLAISAEELDVRMQVAS
eukprot:6464849-Amphidinium_carterae.2